MKLAAHARHLRRQPELARMHLLDLIASAPDPELCPGSSTDLTSPVHPLGACSKPGPKQNESVLLQFLRVSGVCIFAFARSFLLLTVIFIAGTTGYGDLAHLDYSDKVKPLYPGGIPPEMQVCVVCCALCL